MSIHSIAVRWAAALAKELGSDQREQNRMAYGLELLLGEIVKWIVLLSLAGIMGLWREIIIITVSASILRLASGGEHCNEYYRCMVGGTIWFLLLGWIVRYGNMSITVGSLLVIAGISFASAFILLALYAPGDTENKPINTNAERTKFKRLSLILVVVYLIAMIGTALAEAVQFVCLPVAVGMLAQVFTVTPLGYRFLHWVDRVLTFD
jgi:accessory gene regulator B